MPTVGLLARPTNAVARTERPLWTAPTTATPSALRAKPAFTRTEIPAKSVQRERTRPPTTTQKRRAQPMSANAPGAQQPREQTAPNTTQTCAFRATRDTSRAETPAQNVQQERTRPSTTTLERSAHHTASVSRARTRPKQPTKRETPPVLNAPPVLKNTSVLKNTRRRRAQRPPTLNARPRFASAPTARARRARPAPNTTHPRAPRATRDTSRRSVLGRSLPAYHVKKDSSNPLTIPQHPSVSPKSVNVMTAKPQWARTAPNTATPSVNRAMPAFTRTEIPAKNARKENSRTTAQTHAPRAMPVERGSTRRRRARVKPTANARPRFAGARVRTARRSERARWARPAPTTTTPSASRASPTFG